MASAVFQSIPINLIEPNMHFEDRIYQLDLRFSRAFALAGPGRLQAMFDVYNALNGSAILGVNNTFAVGEAWRSPATILDSRIVKFGVQYDF